MNVYSNNHDDNVRDLTLARATSTHAQAVKDCDEARLNKWMAKVDADEGTSEMGERTHAIYSETDPERNPYLNDKKNVIKDVKRIAAAGALAIAAVLAPQLPAFNNSGNTPADSVASAPSVAPKTNLEKFDISKLELYYIINVPSLDEAINAGYLIENSSGDIFPADGLDWARKKEVDLDKPETLSLIVLSKG